MEPEPLLDGGVAVGMPAEVEVREVEGQPLAAQALRLKQAMEFLGAPLSAPLAEKLVSEQPQGRLPRRPGS